MIHQSTQQARTSESLLSRATLDVKAVALCHPAAAVVGERGIGGSKCGATAVNALMYTAKDGTTKLATANVGDARIILIRGGQPVLLTEEHVPDA